MLLLIAVYAHAQVSHQHKTKSKKIATSKQLKRFVHLAAKAGLDFQFPDEFKEIEPPASKNLTFDYAITLPGKDFEIWFHIKPEKEKPPLSSKAQPANPDSLYVDIAKANASALAGDNNYLVRNIPPPVLSRYNADAGRSYLLTLLDLPATRRYKYALLITLQKNNSGAVLAVCFTNDKGPEFFKNMSKANKCLKFKS